MALVSMKRESDDRGEVACCPDNPYGYGLLIRLSEGQCEALGITTPPVAGSKVMITAAAYVSAATQSVENDADDTGPDITLELQITDMALGPAAKATDAKAMYGNSEMS